MGGRYLQSPEAVSETLKANGFSQFGVTWRREPSVGFPFSFLWFFIFFIEKHRDDQMEILLNMTVQVTTVGQLYFWAHK